MIQGVAAAASDADASAAAETALQAGAGAVDALIAGFFAAAGADSSVLFAPALALVGGLGMGTRAFDGRNAQPGLGAPRPRGFASDAAVPEAARASVPRSIPMIALLHTHGGRAKLGELARFGVRVAERSGASRRSEILGSIGDAGVIALRAGDVLRALVAAAGPVAGGLLTPGDIEEARPIEAEAHRIERDGATIASLPWEPAESSGPVRAILAADARGVVGVLCYAPPSKGVEVPELELTLACEAIPVQRGVRRVAPGTPRPGPAPIAIASAGGLDVAVAFEGLATMAMESMVDLVGGTPLETAAVALAGRFGARRVLAVARDRRRARGLAIELPSAR